MELRCNFVMASFVKKTLKKAHGTLVDRLCQKAATASPDTPSPGISPKGSISSDTGIETSDIREADAAYTASAGRSSHRFSAGQAYSQPLYAQPNPCGNTTAPHGYTPYRRPAPPPQYDGSTNGWAGGQQQALAELQ